MTISLTILCDNTAVMKEGIQAEHGYSVFIETEKVRLLLDTGQSDVFWHNAEVLGKDLTNLDGVVLSHGHYDHTGGLLKLAQVGKLYKVMGHRDVFAKRFKTQKDGQLKYIGCPYDRQYLESRGLTFSFLGSHEEITPNVYFVSGVPRRTEYEKGDSLLVVRNEAGGTVSDPFRDDASIYIRTPKGIVVVLGCSHRGVVNILSHILTLEGDVPILCVIGGTHLSRVDPYQVEKTIEALYKMAPRAVGVSHCTGLEAADEMKRVLGDRFFRAMAGMTITIDEEGGITYQ